MKKIITYIFIISFLLLIGKIIYDSSIKYYSITYDVNQYKIKETFNKENTNNYLFEINNNNITYQYTNQMSNRKKQIKKIETFKSNKLNCIIPIYKSNKEYSLYCNQNQEQILIIKKKKLKSIRFIIQNQIIEKNRLII